MPKWVVSEPWLHQPPLPRARLEPGCADRSHEAPVACPDLIFNNRNVVERLWVRPKEWRAVATRYEKTAASFSGILCLAATLDRLK